MPTCVICGINFENKNYTPHQTCSKKCTYELVAIKNSVPIPVGAVFGTLTIIGFSGGRYLAECACGGSITARSSEFRRGRVKGCARCAKKNVRYGDDTRSTPTWQVWNGMKQRVSSNSFRIGYTDRGIKMCDEWELFSNFKRDMGEKPEGKSLDRINNNGDYSKENCRWATPREQALNTRSTVHVELDGVTKPLSIWAEEFGISLVNVHARRSLGWSDEAAIKTPVRPRKTPTRRPSAKSAAEVQAP